MISVTLRIAMLIAIVVYFILLFAFLKNKKLNMKYSLLWIFAGILMLILAIWPGILGWFSTALGIELPVNALFAMMFFCMIVILISITSIVSKQSTEIKVLTQEIALLENRVRELEKK